MRDRFQALGAAPHASLPRSGFEMRMLPYTTTVSRIACSRSRSPAGYSICRRTPRASSRARKARSRSTGHSSRWQLPLFAKAHQGPRRSTSVRCPGQRLLPSVGVRRQWNRNLAGCGRDLSIAGQISLGVAAAKQMTSAQSIAINAGARRAALSPAPVASRTGRSRRTGAADNRRQSRPNRCRARPYRSPALRVAGRLAAGCSAQVDSGAIVGLARFGGSSEER